MTRHGRVQCRRAEAMIIAPLPRRAAQRSALLPMLHLVQSVEGYVTPDGIAFCAEELGLTKAEVGAVATFYTMYKRRPAGDYLVSVCTNTLCGILGGEEIFDALTDELGVGHNETTADGTITLEHAECLAACDYAPVVTVNYEFYDQRQTPRQRWEHASTQLRAPASVPDADPRRRCARSRRSAPARRLPRPPGRRRSHEGAGRRAARSVGLQARAGQAASERPRRTTRRAARIAHCPLGGRPRD